MVEPGQRDESSLRDVSDGFLQVLVESALVEFTADQRHGNDMPDRSRSVNQGESSDRLRASQWLSLHPGQGFFASLRCERRPIVCSRLAQVTFRVSAKQPEPFLNGLFR